MGDKLAWDAVGKIAKITAQLYDSIWNNSTYAVAIVVQDEIFNTLRRRTGIKQSRVV